ncbi:hypothetical protein [Sphingobium sp. WCS2017Hpa-17]|uniref:hypothetical protein n=1 Tax=Sphingobium sp. WCS2017Hpa-17 TaxID=3073638 RepID=UPI00288A9A42|nr:hypothetical protein [Sphingobium sp. WCS2017Hpa-17]
MKPLSRHLDRLLTSHIRAERKTWAVVKQTLPQRRRRKNANALFLRKMTMQDRLKQGCRIWWPKGDHGHAHLFSRSPIALAEGSLTPRHDPRPRCEVPVGRNRFFIDTVPF